MQVCTRFNGVRCVYVCSCLWFLVCLGQGLRLCPSCSGRVCLCRVSCVVCPCPCLCPCLCLCLCLCLQQRAMVLELQNKKQRSQRSKTPEESKSPRSIWCPSGYAACTDAEREAMSVCTDAEGEGERERERGREREGEGGRERERAREGARAHSFRAFLT